MRGFIGVLLSCFVLGCAAGVAPDLPGDPKEDGGDPPSGDTGAPPEDTGTTPPEDTGPPATPRGEAGLFPKKIAISGVGRDYYVYAPASALKTAPAPLLVLLHGAGDTAQNFMSAIGMKATADKRGFLLVVPNAYKKAWFLSDAEGWGKADGASTTSLSNDVALILKALEETQAA